jgi:hypothetical protein
VTADACPCGQPLAFDPAYRGTTVAGLDLVGAMVCAACGHAELRKGLSREAEAVDWSLAKSGRSINAGGLRIRVDGQGDVAGLMARIVQLPALEVELAVLRSQPATADVDTELQAARDAFDRAAMQIAAVLDHSISGDDDARDPTKGEQEDFEEAGLKLGRLLNQRAARATRTKGTP